MTIEINFKFKRSFLLITDSKYNMSECGINWKIIHCVIEAPNRLIDEK